MAIKDEVAFGVGVVLAVSCSTTHTFSKQNQESIQLLAGLGVEGDAHLGKTVKHRSRVASDLTQPNLRQVHLIHAELYDELRSAGFSVSAGQMGENITTHGIDLLALPTGTRLHLMQYPHTDRRKREHLVPLPMPADTSDSPRTMPNTSSDFALGDIAVVEVTGLRNPCLQLDNFQPGLMAAVLGRNDQGQLIRKAGVMGIVLASGQVRPGYQIRVELPPTPYRPLDRV